MSSVPLEVYGSLPQFEAAAISPSGERIAVVATIGGARLLVVLDGARKPILSYDLKYYKLDDVEWAGNEAVLVDLRDTIPFGMDFVNDKYDVFSTLVLPIGDKKPWVVFGGKHEIVAGIRQHFGVSRKNDKIYGYFSAITMELGGGAEYHIENTSPDLYQVDLDSGMIDRIDSLPVASSARRTWLVRDDGEIAATLDFASKTGAWRITNTRGNLLVSGSQPYGSVSLVAFGPGGTTLVYKVSDDQSGIDHLFQMPLGGGEAKLVLEDEEIRYLYIDRHRRLIGYQADSDGDANFFNARHLQVMEGIRKALAGRSVRLVDVDEAWQKVIVKTDGADDPGTWWLVDVKSGSANVLGTSYILPKDEIGAIQTVDFRSGDGLGLQGILTLPPKRDPIMLPVVVLPHSGPSGRDYVEFDWLAQSLASLGYAVFQPNFRGSTGYGPAFRRAGYGQWGRLMQSDISDGVAELARRKIVDPSRACIMGIGYGGYAALAGVTLQHGLYRCAVSLAGVGDLLKLYHSEVHAGSGDPARARALKNEIGTTPNMESVSPINLVGRIDVPVMLIHGKDDTIVDIEQSKAMLNAMKSVGKNVQLVTLEREDHWLSRSVTRNLMLKAATDFIRLHNPPN